MKKTQVQFYNRSCIHITAIQPYRSPHRNMPLDITQHGKTCSIWKVCSSFRKKWLVTDMVMVAHM